MERKVILLASILLITVLAACTQAATQPTETVQKLAPSVTNSAAGNTPAPSAQTSAPQQPKETPQPAVQAAKIGDILSKPDNFVTTNVVIEGRIISECGAGCWFTINDGTGTIYVDLAPSNLTIPQKRGAFARVYGKVVARGGDVYIIGEKVEF